MALDVLDSIFDKYSRGALCGAGVLFCVLFSATSIFVPIGALSSILALIAGVSFSFAMYPFCRNVKEWKEKNYSSSVRVYISLAIVGAFTVFAYLLVKTLYLPMQVGATIAFGILALCFPYMLPTASEFKDSKDGDAMDGFFDGALEGAGVTGMVRRAKEKAMSNTAVEEDEE